MECPRDPRVWIACWEDAMINFLIYSVCFVFLGSKVTMDGDCSHGIKRCLLLGRKAMTNLDSIFKSRDITLPKRILIIKAMVFLAVMHGCESWTIKQAEHWRTDAFKLWCWRRLLRVPWTTRKSQQSILKEVSFEYSLEGLMLKLKLQYFGYLMWRADSLEKTLMLEKSEGKRRRGWQRMRWLDNITTSMEMNLRKLQKIVEDRGAWHPTVHGVAKSQTRLSGWSTITYSVYRDCFFYCCLVDQCVWLFATPWTVTHQAFLSMGILQARILEWVAKPSSRGRVESNSGYRWGMSLLGSDHHLFLLFIPGCGWSDKMGLGVR